MKIPFSFHCKASATLLVLFCLFFYTYVPPSFADEEHFELSPAPPKIYQTPEIQSGQVSKLAQEKDGAKEWIYHKTADGLHPNGEEQQMVWFTNRARANPGQEGVWLAAIDDADVVSARNYFDVDLAVLQSEFAGYAPKPPAAYDRRLYQAAAWHNDYLIAIDDQVHTNQFTRVTAAGFVYDEARGNVYSYSRSVLYGHAGFNIDWGTADDGMQAGRGHRQGIMSLDGEYTNVGIAIAYEDDTTTSVGPQVITQNFCHAGEVNGELAEDHYNRFVVGTVWQDSNQNDQYDPGEGLGGVSVRPDAGAFYAVTSESGGYAYPVTTAGDYQVTFSGDALPVSHTYEITVAGESVLLDHEVVEEPLDEEYEEEDVPEVLGTGNSNGQVSSGPSVLPALLLLLSGE